MLRFKGVSSSSRPISFRDNFARRGRNHAEEHSAVVHVTRRGALRRIILSLTGASLVCIRGRTGAGSRVRSTGRSVQDVSSGGNVCLALREAEQGA